MSTDLKDREASVFEARERSRLLLKLAFGPGADFRDGQWESIEPLLEGGKRQLVVQRTGWGKSVVYFLATKLLRESGKGPTLLISPLLALMRNQIEMSKKLGLRAASINSANRDERERIESEVLHDQIDLLLVSPERLADTNFRKRLLPRFMKCSGLLVIDEAHCISDWGHDFRPDYRRILRLVDGLNPDASVLATTATANNRVIADLQEQFGAGLEVRRGSLERASLRLNVFQMDDHADRLAWLAKYVPRLPGTGIIYVLTVNDAEQAAKWMRELGVSCFAYHADLTNERRLELERQFLRNEVKALVATTALGMGYDKLDVGFVVHCGMPGSPLAYYQQVGRAGRSLETAYAALLWTEDDREVTEHFIDSALPPRWIFEALLAGMKTEPKTLSECLAGLKQTPPPVVKHAIELLEAEGIVEKSPLGLRLTESAQLDWRRMESVRAERLHELAQMELFVRHEGCRMQLLLAMLDETEPSVCGVCDICKPHSPISLPAELVEHARGYLRQSVYEIKPLQKIPSGVDVGRVKTFRPDEMLMPGIALSSYNDPGWGRMVCDGKYEALEYSDELVKASAYAIRKLGIGFEWLTWAPSTSHGLAVAQFASRLASELGIPAVDSVRRIEKRSPQKVMGTSQSQFLNAWGAFEIVEVRKGNCLLVDDVVDSGWTLAIIGLLLRQAGSGPVMPFALATARPRRSAI